MEVHAHSVRNTFKRPCSVNKDTADRPKLHLCFCIRFYGFYSTLAGTKYSPLPQNAWIDFEVHRGPSSLGSGVLPVELKRLGLAVTCSPPSSIEVKKEEAITRLHFFGFTTQKGTNISLLRFMRFVKKTEDTLRCRYCDYTTSMRRDIFIILRSVLCNKIKWQNLIEVIEKCFK